MAVELRGWRPDPYRQHELRYFSMDGQPSRLVSSGGKTSLDPPWPAPLSPRPLLAVATAPMPAQDWGVEPRRSLETLDVGDGTMGLALRVFGDAEAGPTRQRKMPQILESMMRNLSDTQRESVRRVIRFGSVSAISTVVGIVSLGIFIGLLGYPVVWSNILAKGIAVIPAFELSRRWVWAQSGKRSILRQALPFALFSFAGLILSTIAVHLAVDATAHSSRLIHTATAELASIASYIPLLLIQFMLCDRVLFRSARLARSMQPAARETGQRGPPAELVSGQIIVG
jgi:putative flippase GtrA